MVAGRIEGGSTRTEEVGTSTPTLVMDLTVAGIMDKETRALTKATEATVGTALTVHKETKEEDMEVSGKTAGTLATMVASSTAKTAVRTEVYHYTNIKTYIYKK